MSLSIGIVGLPNVGKSTLFNALSNAQNAESANYPFCTIEPNQAIVPVPDKRVDALAEIVSPERIQAATVTFVDIAGLVRGASKGEGLGNQFLGNIRSTNAILQVVRCFEDENVVHVDGDIDPIRDLETIELELALADLDSVQRRIEKLEKQVKGNRSLQAELDEATKLAAHFDEGKPFSTYADKAGEQAQGLAQELGLLTAKSMIYCANVDEDGIGSDNDHVGRLKEYAAARDIEVIKLCAKAEEDLAGLSDAEKAELLEMYGAEHSGLEQVIRKGYAILGYISYFTAGVKEVRAWTVEEGSSAPQAAGVIHTDFERGFIRAEVTAYDAYVDNGGEAGAKAAGQLRVEGKEYIVKDGDVMHFRFNV